MTWTVANSPYTVTGDVQVPVGSTLTINPGVTVKYAGAYKIYVQGTLIANGTVGSPIVFGSTSAGVSSGATMLKFEGTNLSNSQLSYVQMSDAAKAIMVGGGGGEFNPGVACTGTLTVTQSSITNAEVRTGGYQTTAKLVLEQATVTNATIIGQYPRSEAIEVTNSTVTGSVINSDSYNQGITLTNTTVGSSQLQMGCCGANLTLIGGTVSGSTVTTTNSGDGPFVITGTSLANTPITLPNTPVTITGATFTYTSGATSPKLQFKSGTVTNTTISGNGGAVGLEFGSGYGDVMVSGTTITDFATGLRFSGVRSGGMVTVGTGNQFSNNSSYNLDNRTATAVNATGNTWGTTDAVQIAQKIYDYADDTSLGAVTTVNAGLLAITGQPSTQFVSTGTNVSLTVTATGIPAPTYQWYKNGSAIGGATNSTLSLNNVQVADAATYVAGINNSAGALTSSGATLTVAASGPINVSGLQSGNVTWPAALSPYIVTGDVQVPVGSTLAINPGVTVKYAGAYKIYVQGTLIANGTVGSPIVFGSTSAGVSSGATMLKFEGTNLSNSQLSYVQMSDAAKAIMVGGGGGEFNPGVACTGTLTVTQSSITNAEVRTGGYQTTAKLVLDHTTVTNATIIGQYPRSEPIELTTSTVSNSVINSDSYNLGITLTNSAVSNSQLQMGCCGANLTLIGGTVSNSTVTTTNSGDGPFTISGTTLTDTTITLPNTPATITGATFSYSSGTVSPKLQFKSGAVTSTTITGNSSGVGLEFASGYGDVTVSGTTITNFATGLRFTGVRSGGTLTVGTGNQFNNNSNYNLDNRTATAVDATGNSWGTTDALLIAQKIYDGADAAGIGAVTLVNAGLLAITGQPSNQTVASGGNVIFTVAATGTPAPTYQWYKDGLVIVGATGATLSFSNVQNADAATYAAVISNSAGSLVSSGAILTLSAGGPTNISGVQNGNMIWSTTYSPYIVTGDVQVPVGSTLTINPGVTVKYAGAYQIYVQGTLIANGSSGSPIVLSSTSAGVSSGATMLKFEGTNLSNSQLSYLQMSDAAKAIMVGGGGGEFNPGVACTGTLTVTQSSITNAEVRTGGYQTTAKLVLDHTTVTNATIIGQYPRSEPIELTTSSVSNSVIHSDSYNLGITLMNSAVSNSQLQMGCCGANLTLIGGTVSNSTVTTTNSGDGPFSIVGTILTNTPITLPNAPATISGAIFTYATGATSPKLQFKSGTVTNTMITGDGSSVGLEFSSGYGDVTVSGTTITDFATGLRFSGVRSGGTLRAEHFNVFERNSSYNLDNRTATAVSATQNFWGTADAGQITQKIFDQVDDISSGLVTSGTYLTSSRIPVGFDILAYYARNPDVQAMFGGDSYGAWLYYRSQGIYQGEVFDDLFRVEEYLVLYPNLFELFGNDLGAALDHWLSTGRIEGKLGRIPLEFNATGYFTRNPDVATAVGNDPLLAWGHYWLYGIYEGRAYDDELRVFEYLAINADLTAAFVDDWRQAALHWMRYGRTEGRLGRLALSFNVTEYLNRNPDVLAVFGTNPTTVFLHYWAYGIDENRTYDELFRPDEYLAQNPDLIPALGSDHRKAFKHWVRYGQTEGRAGKNP